MRIDFYHLQNQNVFMVLPALTFKVLANNQRLVILTSSQEQVDSLNSFLWTFEQDAWIPHGCYKTEEAAFQPVWITEEYENPNHAEIIMILDGMNLKNYHDFQRCLYVFDGNQEEELKKARLAWSTAKEHDCELHYWQQEAGKWIEKI